ncbi:Uncharacterized protein dnl_21070 [Desulfonema limicola]|uniref:Uncharacterized protein n=1 Tax=Desulfonema limicola TaxID=45656 RepID=A0A975B6Q1_9BACT|nr:hypothetical protein [Desulfonema limicola]QTA79825.1 Uncharacterized protein dnl_21070 [Desulfonema limicola]
MYYVDFNPKMIISDFLRQISKDLLNKKDMSEYQDFLKDLSQGLIDADKLRVKNEEDYLQF